MSVKATSVRKVLVAIKIGDHASNLLDTAASVAQMIHGDIEIVHVTEPFLSDYTLLSIPGIGSNITEEIQSDKGKKTLLALEDVVDTIRQKYQSLKVEGKLLAGNPREAIAGAIEKSSAAIVVVGAAPSNHRFTPWAGRLQYRFWKVPRSQLLWFQKEPMHFQQRN